MEMVGSSTVKTAALSQGHIFTSKFLHSKLSTVVEIKCEMQKVLDMHHQEDDFQDTFQKWQKHREHCIAVQRNYFEGDNRGCIGRPSYELGVTAVSISPEAAKATKDQLQDLAIGRLERLVLCAVRNYPTGISHLELQPEMEADGGIGSHPSTAGLSMFHVSILLSSLHSIAEETEGDATTIPSNLATVVPGRKCASSNMDQSMEMYVRAPTSSHRCNAVEHPQSTAGDI
ncbi:hypothetical protein PR048_031642 [Dryococelus australis]|uniref:Uncharacterized protein n=1 Tax=Dryococelus australis TaxID=614101 RepID=A0ABQ9G8N3_9NEOP|nr:hypothetical protein PR048_031642 [Dryococelus australis]